MRMSDWSSDVCSSDRPDYYQIPKADRDALLREEAEHAAEEAALRTESDDDADVLDADADMLDRFEDDAAEIDDSEPGGDRAGEDGEDRQRPQERKGEEGRVDREGGRISITNSEEHKLQ